MKKILIIGPILPQWSDIDCFSKNLSFLKKDYNLSFFDPFKFFDKKITLKFFYQKWRNFLKKQEDSYDVFMGFSFGGVILQQCFSFFEISGKPIVLFSTPSFSDDLIHKKLSKVVFLAGKGLVKEAILCLNKHVYYPNMKIDNFVITELEQAANRLSFGLKSILTTDSRKILQSTHVNYLNLIGEHSDLVNYRNVIEVKSGKVVQVPNSGMRVLECNQDYCINSIKELLA